MSDHGLVTRGFYIRRGALTIGHERVVKPTTEVVHFGPPNRNPLQSIP